MISHLEKYPERIVEIQGIAHSHRILHSYLNETQWITDTILNAYLSTFQSHNRVENTLICSSFEFCVIERNLNLVHLAEKLCSFHRLLMPICIGNHWLVADFYPFCSRLDVYDSLYLKNDYLEQMFTNFWATVQNLKGWKTDLIISFNDAPKQSDRNSCGIYCISFIRSLHLGIPFPDIDHGLTSIRENILYTILESKFNS